jgi:Flp pilus assembly protein CpaB
MLLVLGGAAVGVLAAARLGATASVLVLARPVAVGHVLTEEDLREQAMPADAGIDAVPAGELPDVVGRPAAYTLPAGIVLTRAALGSPQLPPPGQAIAAVALDAGRFPPGLAPGTRVAVVAAPGPAGAAAVGARAPAVPASRWPATVTAVDERDDERTTVVSLLLAEDDAAALAAAADERVRVVAVHGGGR